MRRPWVMAVLFVASLLLIGEIAQSARKLSATWDEPYHMLAGYRYWQAADYGINPERPPLGKLVAAFPLLFMRLRVPGVGPYVSQYTANISGREFVFRNDANATLFRARLAEAVFGLLLLFLVI
jgi:hypothetical protein